MSDLFINMKDWAKFTPEEMEEYREKVFQYFRTTGFPYFPTTSEWRINEYNKIQKYDYRKCIDEPNKIIRQTMHGLSLCWSYHPYHYEVPCNDKRTVMGTFMDDDLLRKVIRKRTSYGANMSDNGLRKMIKVFSGTQCVSNFRPTAAAAIYHRFCESGDTVFDMSSGFGGRLLGAHLNGNPYIGTDPSAEACVGNWAMNDEFSFGSRLLCRGSECDLPLFSNSIDFCFTSPPYFNTERYSDHETQSYVKFPEQHLWLNGFLKKTFKNCHRILKQDKLMVINIADVPSYKNLVDDTIRVAGEVGFKLDDIWGLQLSSLAKGGHKTEPLLIFRRQQNE